MSQKHPSFSLSSPGGTANTWQQNNPKFQGQRDPGFVNQQRQQFQPQQPNQPSLEDLIKAFIVKTDERSEVQGAEIRNLQKNPKEIVDVVTLRGGQVLKDPTPVQNDVEPKKGSGEQMKIDVDKEKKGKKGAEKKEENSRREEPEESYSKLTIHKSALTNASLCQILQGDPDKEEEPQWKLENEIGEIRSAPISLQLADQTTLVPEGIVEDVLVRVDKFVFSVDFIVVKMEEKKEVPLILGRPFLATGRAILDIHKRKLMLGVGEETVTFEMNVATGVKRDKPTASVE
ncbi:PREDICTED: uncharacterized protein LOC109218693 [Nicotiana attenuata]|uniref:uncharacterized protein LOC109218693 n=1 Tax=Nicotiana attenuata TaxID=49451 RepID=UPI000904F966|nr:PREDICTED: uncharacterized protein LOC109218693 [Nicotiana attenuata]